MSKFASLGLIGCLSAVIGAAVFTLVINLDLLISSTATVDDAKPVLLFFIWHAASALNLGWPIFMFVMPVMFHAASHRENKTVGRWLFPLFGMSVAVGLLIYGYRVDVSKFDLALIKTVTYAAVGGFFGGRAFWNLGNGVTKG